MALQTFMILVLKVYHLCCVMIWLLQFCSHCPRWWEDMMSIGILLSIGNHVACALYKSPCYYFHFFWWGRNSFHASKSNFNIFVWVLVDQFALHRTDLLVQRSKRCVTLCLGSRNLVQLRGVTVAQRRFYQVNLIN